MKTFRTIGDKQLRPVYSLDIVEREDGSRIVYFNSEVHVEKRTKIGPDYGHDLSHAEILRHVLPYAIRKFGRDIIQCPHCGA